MYLNNTKEKNNSQIIFEVDQDFIDEEFIYSLNTGGLIGDLETELIRRKAGLSTAHIRRKHHLGRERIEELLAAELMNRTVISKKKGYLEIYPQGSLVSVRLPHIKYQGRNTGGGIRGKIVGFSRKSRRRMLKKVATFQRSRKPLFLTLTYPDEYKESRLDGNKLKEKDLKNFWLRLEYHYPQASCLWKIEYVKRKSGKYRGKLFPHFHLMIWNLNDEDLQDLRKFAAMNWWEVVGTLSDDHLKAGTRLERIRSIKGVFHYTAKYMGKQQGHDLEIGRWWGLKNRTSLPISHFERFEFLEEQQLEKVMLIIMGMLDLPPGRWLSLSCFMDAKILWDDLEQVLFDT